MKEKVLIVHNYYQIPGGEDTVVANEKKMLEENGHEVFLYTRDNKELKNMSKVKKLLLPLTTVFNIRTYRDIRRIIKEKKINIVHVHNTLTLISPSVYYAALSCGVPVVQTVHNFRLLCPGATFYRDRHICEDCVTKGLSCAIKHKCYRNSRLQTLACVINTKIHRMTGIYGKINYICLTEFNKEKLLQLKQIKEDRVFVKPNFVKEEPIRNNEREFYVFVGRLEEIKGIRELIQVWKELGDNAPLLKICGDGPLMDECTNYVKNEHLDNVEIMGFVKHDEVKDIISKSRYLILPTKVYEGFPMTIIEAFSEGTPVIVPNMGNARDLIQENVNGFKYDSESLDSFVECIKNSVNSSDLEISTIQNFRNKYTDSINIQLIEQIYEKIGGAVVAIHEVTQMLSASKRENQFIFIGRLDKLKGIDILLKIWEQLGEIAPKLVVCGTGPMDEWCREFVTKNRCNVELKGFVSNLDAKEMIAKSLALILPTQWYEGFPMTIVESYSVGTPVICSDLGNCGAVVVNGITGWKYRNKEQLIDILAEAERTSIYSIVRAFYNRHYSDKVNYNLLSDIYADISKVQNTKQKIEIR